MPFHSDNVLIHLMEELDVDLETATEMGLALLGIPHHLANLGELGEAGLVLNLVTTAKSSPRGCWVSQVQENAHWAALHQQDR